MTFLKSGTFSDHADLESQSGSQSRLMSKNAYNDIYVM